jgi:hypothetical protein
MYPFHGLVSSIEEKRAPTRHHEDPAMKLTINESPVDRIIRIVAGLGLAGLAIAGVMTGPIAYAVSYVPA